MAHSRALFFTGSLLLLTAAAPAAAPPPDQKAKLDRQVQVEAANLEQSPGP